jgi:hypothetical protein
MYLPKFKTTKARYTPGSQYVVKSTEENYIGYYVISSQGVPYSGREFVQNASLELVSRVTQGVEQQEKEYVPYTNYDTVRKQQKEYNLRSTLDLPVHIFIPDFEFEINKRFFAKSKVTQAIKEISREVYLELSGKTTKYHYPTYEILAMDWYVTGAVGDFQNGSYLIEGIRTKNTKEIAKAEKSMPGISQVVTNPLQGIA